MMELHIYHLSSYYCFKFVLVYRIPLKAFQFLSHSTENLKKPLEEQVQQFEKVKIIRMPQREGLVRARLRGAEVSRGEVLTFLDSHCEATEGWLEPLLARIAQNRTNVVCPVIEVVNADDFGYQTSDVIYERGGFSWDLFFTWKAIPEEEKKRREDETDFIRHVKNLGVVFCGLL